MNSIHENSTIEQPIDDAADTRLDWAIDRYKGKLLPTQVWKFVVPGLDGRTYKCAIMMETARVTCTVTLFLSRDNGQVIPKHLGIFPLGMTSDDLILLGRNVVTLAVDLGGLR